MLEKVIPFENHVLSSIFCGNFCSTRIPRAGWSDGIRLLAWLCSTGRKTKRALPDATGTKRVKIGQERLSMPQLQRYSWPGWLRPACFLSNGGALSGLANFSKAK